MGKGRSEPPLVPAVFQVSLAQNKLYANVAEFAVAHSVTLHYLKMSVRHPGEGADMCPSFRDAVGTR